MNLPVILWFDADYLSDISIAHVWKCWLFPLLLSLLSSGWVVHLCDIRVFFIMLNYKQETIASCPGCQSGWLPQCSWKIVKMFIGWWVCNISWFDSITTPARSASESFSDDRIGVKLSSFCSYDTVTSLTINSCLFSENSARWVSL